MAEQTTNLNLIKPEYDDTADIADINTNSDAIDTAIAGLKPKQTAVTDPTASGTAAAFISGITQNANGVITPSKKTVRTMTGATSSAAGATGLVPAPGTGDVGKFLKGDGSWGTPTNTTYSAATSSALGLVKIGYTASGKNYPVQLDTNSKAYVNVPWTDNNTTYSAASSSNLGLIKIGYSQSGKNYPVQLDTNNKAYVNVPWTDNNTTYVAATSSALGLIKIGYTSNSKNYAVQLDANGKAYVNVPWTTPGNATTSAAGLMSATDKSKLDGIQSGAQVNPSAATQSAAGLMSKADKIKLDGIASGAQVNPGAATSSAYGLIKIGYTASGKNYPVQLSSGKAYVNVPWTDNNTWRGFSVESFHYDYTIAANGTKDITGTNFGVGKSGYSPVAVCMFNPGSPHLYVTALNCQSTGNNPVMTVHNTTNSSMSPQAWIAILYLQN